MIEKKKSGEVKKGSLQCNNEKVGYSFDKNTKDASDW